jgi:hypothetical protein
LAGLEVARAVEFDERFSMAIPLLDPCCRDRAKVSGLVHHVDVDESGSVE